MGVQRAMVCVLALQELRRLLLERRHACHFAVLLWQDRGHRRDDLQGHEVVHREVLSRLASLERLSIDIGCRLSAMDVLVSCHVDIPCMSTLLWF